MKSALLVIDAQNIYTNTESELYCEDSPSTIANINSLISNARKNKIPIVFIKHQHKQDGSDSGYLFDHEGTGEPGDISFIEGSNDVEIDSSVAIKDGDPVITKTRYSSFIGTSLNEILTAQNVKRVVVSGFMTNFCCESTARSALDLDFLVDFVVDATGTPGTTDYNQEQTRVIVGNLLGAGFARIFWTTNDFLQKQNE